MRVLVEVLAADFGGVRTYVENLLRVWERRYPGDELVVVVPCGSPVSSYGHERHEIALRGPAIVSRPVVQSTVVPRLARQVGADVVLATLPPTSLRRTRFPTAVVVYDFRHEVMPEQFSRRQRLKRAISYRRGYAVADGFVAISQRTLDDLRTLHPQLAAKPAVVAYLGADHVLEWPPPTGDGPAIAFGHHTNKNIDLILDGYALIVGHGDKIPDLLILGTDAVTKPMLSAKIADLGIADRVSLAPFLDEPEFRRVFSSSSMIIFPSDLEGFGLPVAEGMLLGIPVVIGPERTTLEVSGGHATVLADWTPQALADAVVAAATLSAAQLEAAKTAAERFTWADCVDTTRSFLAALSEPTFSAR